MYLFGLSPIPISRIKYPPPPFTDAHKEYFPFSKKNHPSNSHTHTHRSYKSSSGIDIDRHKEKLPSFRGAKEAHVQNQLVMSLAQYACAEEGKKKDSTMILACARITAPFFCADR